MVACHAAATSPPRRKAPVVSMPSETWIEAVLAHRDTLSARDLLIAELRTYAHPGVTLQELATRLNVSRERVSQLEQRWIGRCTVVQPEAPWRARSCLGSLPYPRAWQTR